MNADDGVLDLEVVQMRKESEGVLSVVLADPEGRTLPAWTPGAHVDLYVGDHVRQYSLCGDPADRTSFRVGVLRERESEGGSAWVHEELRVGDRVEVGGPRNHFELVDAPAYVFVAGGIGITPILPMIRSVEAQGRPWQLAYAGRSIRTMAFLDELRAHEGRVALWDADVRGRVDVAQLVGPGDIGTAVYCCGPESLIDAVEDACADWIDGAAFAERFAGRVLTAEEVANERPFEVVVASTGDRALVDRGRSIVDVLEGIGVTVPNACRDGVCGSCLTRVLKGTPEHRDSLLGPDDTDQMMLCVSRASSDELVLDL